ncbi:MAG: glycosyltransferase [Candidatus Nitrosopolaris sp.]
MKANVIHGDFNPCGGAERLSLVTIQALFEMGIDDIDLTTLTRPNVSKLKNTYGKSLVSILERINKINIINIFEDILKTQLGDQDYDYDITINTNGDTAPYYRPSFSKYNAITYCHFPSTKYHIESESIDYLKTDLGMIERSNGFFDNGDTADIKKRFRRKECYEILKYGYSSLMKNSTVITNSEFSKMAISSALGLDNICTLSPPIDIDTFRNVTLANQDNKVKDIILVIARMAPHKKIENAIRLAKILKDKNIGKGMKIVGNLYEYYFDYYLKIKQLVLDLGLNDYITFEINANLNKLLSIMQESRVYFHPMVGEHFGMAVVEAMAAGLITIVPSIGGPAEFVPQQYQFNTVEHAAEIITDVFNHVPKTGRIKVNNEINKFSNSHFIEGFQTILNELLPRSYAAKINPTYHRYLSK